MRNFDLRSNLPLVPSRSPVRIAMSVGVLAWAARRGYRWAVSIDPGWAIALLYAGT